MPEIKKFMFDNNDFSDAALAIEIISYNEEQMSQAKDESFNQGKNEGVRETRQQQEEKITFLMQKALKEIDNLVSAENRREIEAVISGANLALTVIKQVLPNMMEQNAFKEIENTVILSLKERKNEPRVNIFVPEQHLEFIKNRVEAEIASNGYTNQTLVVADANLSPTDCRIEWTGGGAERLSAEIIQQIENSFANAVKGLTVEAAKQ